MSTISNNLARLAAVAAALLFTFGATAALADQSKPLADVIAEIRTAQGLKADQTIDCSKVTDAQFEEVGEAWMDLMIPDPQRHEMMDRMMGGPGSASLANAHRMMGARYLGCISDDSYGGMMMPGMMGFAGGYGAHGGNTMGYGGAFGSRAGPGMMGGYGGYGGWMHSWGGGIVMWLIMLVVIGLVVYLIVASNHHRNQTFTSGSHSESPQDILRKRYARGEISKDEFERMKKDIG